MPEVTVPPLTLGAFRAYLEALPPGSVGRRGVINEGPLVQYLLSGGAHGAVIATTRIGVRKRLLADEVLAISPPDWVSRYIDRLDSAEPAYGFISRQLALQCLDEVEAEIRSS